MATPDDLFADLVPRSDAKGGPPSQTDALFHDLVPKQDSPGLVYDAGKAAGAGIVKGVVGMAALPGTMEQLGRAGVNWAAGREVVSPEAALPTYGDIKGAVESRTGKLYEPKTTLGKYVGTVAEFAPGMLFPAGAAASAAGRLGLRAAQNVIAPGLASEAAGQLTAGSKAEPYARVAGALVGGAVPNALGRAVSPMRIDPARAEQAATLAAEGIPVTAGQVTGSKPLRYAESVSADTPFAGGRAAQVQEAQAEAFTAATLRRAGIEAPRATPEVLDEAFNRIGQMFESAANFVRVPLRRLNPNGMARDEPIIRRVGQIAENYERTTAEAFRNPLVRRVADDLAEMANTTFSMDGRTYSSLRSQLGKVASKADDPATREALFDMQHAIDNAAEAFLRRHIQGRDTAVLADQLRQARREYRNILVIEKAAASAGENAALGLLSPAAVRNAARQQSTRAYVRGGGDFGSLARAGTAVMSPLPNSGTGPRVGTQLLGAAIGSGIGSMMGGAPGAVMGSLAPVAGQAIMGRAVMNPLMQQYFTNQLAAPLRDLPRGNRYPVLPGVIVQGEDR